MAELNNLNNNLNKKDETKVAPIRIPDFGKKVFTPVTSESKKLKGKLKPKPKSAIGYVLQGTVFLVLAILVLTAVYFVYNYAQDFMQASQQAKENNLVFENDLVRGDRSRVVSLEAGASKESVQSVVIQALLNERVNKGEISLVMPSYLRDTNINGQRQLVSELQRGDDFFFTFAPHAPLNLRTIAASSYAVGTAGVGNVAVDGSKNFMVFSVSSAPDATREMLSYEAQMYNDMKLLLKLPDLKGTFAFKDLSYNNHLLRVGYDDDGIVMVYGFGAPKTIIMAPDVDTFQMVYEHLK